MGLGAEPFMDSFILNCSYFDNYNRGSIILGALHELDKEEIKMNMNNFIVTEIPKEKILRYEPTKIGEVNGATFYEHPLLGDEAPLVMVTDNLCGITELWEMSDVYNALSNVAHETKDLASKGYRNVPWEEDLVE